MPTSSLRWHVKRAARSGVALCSRAMSRGSAVAAVRVLTYHGIGDAPRDPFYLARDAFAEQMEYLSENGLALSLGELEAFLQGERSVPNGAVVVTIDDGLQSLHREALPILRNCAIPAVAFVSPGLIDGCRPPAPPREPYLTWREVEEVRATGVEIGSHGWSHRSLGELPPDEAEDEVSRSNEVLERRLGARVRAIAYPYGGRPDFTRATRAALARSGCLFGFTSQHGAVRRGCDHLELPRVKVEGGDSMALFRRLPHGAMDPWRIVDRTLWRLQARP